MAPTTSSAPRRRTSEKNPIFWQERTHQMRSGPRIMRRFALIGPVAIALVILGITLTLFQIYNPTREFALYATWLVQAIVMVRAIIAGANVISREHVGQTWDALVLTGVSTRQILLGKWNAAMGRVGPWMLGLGVLRLATIPIYMMALTHRYAWRTLGRYTTYGYSYENLPTIEWLAWASFVAVVATVLLTVLEVMACTALGMAASAVMRRGMTALAFAFSIRFTPVVLFAAFTRYELGGNARVWRVMEFTPLALADSGTSPLAVLSLPLVMWTRGDHERALGGVLLAVLLLGGIMISSLAVSWLAIRLSRALPHSRAATESPAPAFRAARALAGD